MNFNDTTVSMRRRRCRSGIAMAAAVCVLGSSAAGAAHAAIAPTSRGYELVSPADTGDVPVTGGPVGAVSFAVVPDGRVLWTSGTLRPLDETANGFGSSYIAARGPARWGNTGITPSDPTSTTDFVPVDATNDLTAIVMAGSRGTGSVDTPPTGTIAFPSFSSLSRRDASGRYRTLYSVAHPDSGQQVKYIGMAADASVAYFVTDAPPPGTNGTDGVPQVYRVGPSGAITAVGVDDNGQSVSDCGVGPTGVYSATGGSIYSPPGQNNVSNDGSIVYMGTGTFGAAGSCSGALFAGTPGGAVDISAPAAGVPVPASPTQPNYLGASRDGRAAYFKTSDALTVDDGNAGPDIYRSVINPATGTRTSLTCVTCAGSTATDAEVLGYGGSAVLSGDGSHVFFLASGQIDGKGVDGAINLFVAHDGVVGLVSSAADTGNNFLGATSATVRSTPDGKNVVFLSRQDAAGTGGGGQMQLFLAAVGDGASPTPTCVSCDAGGSVPSTLASNTNATGLAQAPGGNQLSGTPRMIADDGSVVAFEVTRGGAGGPSDVYLWEDGRISRVNGGSEQDASSLLGLGADARDVFFLSSAKLSADAIQGGTSLYDARVGGGFAAAPTSTPCAGDACQGPASTAPSASSPSSSAAVPVTAGPRDPVVPKTVAFSARSAGATTTRVTVTIRTPTSGTLRINGRGLRTVRRALSHSATYRIAVDLTAASRKAIRTRGSLRVSLRIRFAPPKGKAITKTVRVTVKRATRSSKKVR